MNGRLKNHCTCIEYFYTKQFFILLTRYIYVFRITQNELPFFLNLLKTTGHVMHQQFNIQQLYVLPTLYLCVLYLSENKQRLVPLTA